MQNIKGGSAKLSRKYMNRSPTPAPVPEYRPEDEATMEDLAIASTVAVKKSARRITRDVYAKLPSADAVPTHIKVQQTPTLRSIVPPSVWRQGPFKWAPVAFGLESDKLSAEKIIEPRVQDQSIMRFLEDPTLPMVYAVSGNPDDQKAKLFAAFLVNAHIQAMGLKANVLWHVMYGGFDNKLLREYDEIDGKSSPSMLVISNLTPNAPGVKLDKTRDLLQRFTDIPVVIVIAGEDPLSFMATRLFSPVHGLAYFSDALVRKRVEII